MAADARKLAVTVMRRNFIEQVPASVQRLITGLLRNVPVTMWKAMFLDGI